MEELGDWQRTHYSKQISPELDGREVILMGWVRAIRTQGKITFIKLADREGFSQVILKNVSSNLLNKFEKISRESVIAVKGTVKANKEAPNKWEIIPIDLKILNLSESPLPLEVETKKTPAELITRLDSRFMDLRKSEVSAIFRISSSLKSSFLKYFDDQKFINVSTPVIVAAATEGGANLFQVKYFDKEAYLSQSPQLYKQILMATGFDKVSILTPAFRAEPHDTPRHINEMTQMDIEVAFVRDEEDALKYYDGYMEYAINHILKKHEEDLKILQVNLEPIKTPIKRITYDEALDIIKSAKIKIKWGEDIPPEGEKVLTDEFNPIIVKKWPTDVRAFYSMPEPSKPKVCRAYDLFYNGLEISSGAQRIHSYNDLIKAMKSRKLDPNNFNFYLNAFRHGMPSHAGFSIGLERLTMAMLKLSNIKEATLFPRTRERLHP